MSIDKNKIFFILISSYPVSIIIGPSVSLVNTLFIIGVYLLIFFKNEHYKFLFKNKTLKMFLLLYLYLIINTLFSINYEIGLGRNLGFVRLIILFIAINYFFYSSKINLKFFYIWTTIFVIFLLDVNLERFSGTNIFGWGAQEIDGVIQPDGTRVVSFFKDEPISGSFIYGFIFLILGYLLLILKNKKMEITYFYF